MPANVSHDSPQQAPAAHRGVSFALATLFWLAQRAPFVLRTVRPLAIVITVRASSFIRRGTRANGERIHRRPFSDAQARAFARGVVGNFYDFVVDVGRARALSVEQLRAKIVGVDGHDRYLACRAAKRGAVLVTAHMGSFEVGLAALSEFERAIHVVFKRDPFAAFERIRAELRTRIGVYEAAIDDGWKTLMQLRAALENDEAIVLQADRAMPGQRAQRVAVCGGHLSLPIGPVTLARIVGSPIVPVFCVREGRGFRVHLLDPIDVSADQPSSFDDAVNAIGRAIERFISRYPDQWLVLEPAFVEDRPGDGERIGEAPSGVTSERR